MPRVTAARSSVILSHTHAGKFECFRERCGRFHRKVAAGGIRRRKRQPEHSCLKENDKDMGTTPINPTPPPVTTPPTSTNSLPSGQSLNNMFLQLLVAQLQNQDPTSPVDPSQFVGQLAQFSELSEVTSIYQLLQQVVPGSTGTGSSGSGSGS